MTRFSPHSILYALAVGLVGFAVIALFSVSSAFLGGMILYVLFNPLYQWLCQRGITRRLAAGMVVIITLFGIVAPLAAMIMVIATHSEGVVHIASQMIDLLGRSEFPVQYADFFQSLNVKQSAIDWLQASGAGLAQRFVSVAGNVGHGVLVIFLLLVLLYYSLIHQDDLKKAAVRYWPSHPEALVMIGYQVRRVTISVVVSTALVAIAQSTIMGVAFWAIGVPNVLLLSALTFILSVVPFIGSPLIWGSVAIWMGLNGNVTAAIVVIGVGLFVSTIDNILRPIFQKRYGELHPVTSLIGVVIGVPVFGFIGLFIGPIALVLMIEILKMALDAFRAESNELHNTQIG